MGDSDLALALRLQEQFDREMAENVALSNGEGAAAGPSGSWHGPSKAKALSIVDESWELTDPNPDVLALFLEFNTTFFWGKLDCVEVKWSPRMTLCAGLCCYEGRGGLCSIKLSLPLLKLRPRKDLVETLLHEMIHALLFVTQNNKDHNAHGPEFLKHMKRINMEAGTSISVYHNFHDEVDLYRQHWWRCDGPCQKWKPYFGIVRRAMNRAPSARDPWWADHLRKCGGTYQKIKEPEGYSNKKGGKRKKNQEAGGVEGTVPSKKKASTTNYGNIELFAGKGFVLGTKSGSSNAGKVQNSSQHLPSASASSSSTSATSVSPSGLPSLPVLLAKGSGRTASNSSSSTSVLSPKSDNVMMNGHHNSGQRKGQQSRHEGKIVTKRPQTKDDTDLLQRPSSSRQKSDSLKNLKITDMFGGTQQKLKDTTSPHNMATSSGQTSDTHSSAHKQSGFSDNSSGNSYTASKVKPEALVSCPVCGEKLPETTINQHLDLCLN